MHDPDHYYYYYYYHHHHNYHNGTGYIYGSRPSWYTDTGKSTVRVHSTHKRPATVFLVHPSNRFWFVVAERESKMSYWGVFSQSCGSCMHDLKGGSHAKK